jgi:predicted metalloprotease with PDZ domain
MGPGPVRFAGPAGAPVSAPAPPAWESHTGLTLRGEGARLVVVNVLTGSAAWRAGVNAGDELVALDGFRVLSPDWLNGRLVERQQGSQATLTVFRRDELINLQLPVVTGPPPRWILRPRPDATPEQQAVLQHWLRTVVPDEAVQEPGLPPPPGTVPPGGSPPPGVDARPGNV